jgi:hypothetical protein
MITKDTGLRLVQRGGFFYKSDDLGYVHCLHERRDFAKVIGSFGNTYHICKQCGTNVFSELTPTAL